MAKETTHMNNITIPYTNKLSPPTEAEWQDFVGRYQAQRLLEYSIECDHTKQKVKDKTKQSILDRTSKAAELLYELAFTDIKPAKFLTKYAPNKIKFSDTLSLLDDASDYSGLDSQGGHRPLNHAIIERIIYKWAEHANKYGFYANESSSGKGKGFAHALRERRLEFVNREDSTLLARTLWELHSNFKNKRVRIVEMAHSNRIGFDGVDSLTYDGCLVPALFTYQIGPEASFTTHYSNYLALRLNQVVGDYTLGVRSRRSNPRKYDLLVNMESLDIDIGNGDENEAHTVMETIANRKSPQPADEAANDELHGRIMRIIDKMTPRYAEVLCHRFGLIDGKDLNQKETAAIMPGAENKYYNRSLGKPITKKRVGQLEEKAIEQFQEYYRKEFGTSAASLFRGEILDEDIKRPEGGYVNSAGILPSRRSVEYFRNHDDGPPSRNNRR